MAIYLGGYSQQNGKEATQQLIQNGSAPSYTFPYAGSSSDRSDYAGKNFKWLDYFYRDPSTNESIFNDARAKAGIYPNVTPYESLTPVGMQWSRFFSVVDSIANSSLATGTYLGATLAGASADTRDGLTIAMGQLAQIGASFMLPKAGISPVFGETTASAKSGTLGLVDEANATLPMGSKVNQMNQPKNPSYQPVRNDPTTVDGTDYAGHALDRMQDRGITPSVVQNTINVGVSTASRGGTTVYYDSVNNVSVVVNAAGKVVTVKYGK